MTKIVYLLHNSFNALVSTSEIVFVQKKKKKKNNKEIKTKKLTKKRNLNSSLTVIDLKLTDHQPDTYTNGIRSISAK